MAPPPVDERVRSPEVESPPTLSRGVSNRSTRRSRKPWLIVLLVLLLIAAGLWFGLAHRASQRSSPQSTAAQPVGAAVIGTGDIRIILNELGTVTPLDTVTVKTQISG